MGAAVIAAAREAGIRSRCSTPVTPQRDRREVGEGQRRFSDGTVERWSSGSTGWSRTDGADRRRDPQRARGRAGGGGGPRAWANERGASLHAHVSEQPAENVACQTPTAAPRPSCSPRRRAVGALHRDPRTHPSDHDRSCSRGGRDLLLLPDDRAQPGRRHRPRRGASRCRGAARGRQRLAGGDRLFEEARAIELDERLARLERGNQDAAALLDARRPTASGRSAGRRQARSNAAGSPTSSTSPATVSASPGSARTPRPPRSSSPRPPPMSPTSSSRRVRSPRRPARQPRRRGELRSSIASLGCDG